MLSYPQNAGEKFIVAYDYLNPRNGYGAIELLLICRHWMLFE